MNFFDSEIVKQELEEIQFLQERVYDNVFKFPSMDKYDKLEHIKVLQDLLNKQRILYTRLKLSDDPEAIDVRQKIEESAIMMGMQKGVDMNIVFRNMDNVIENMKKAIERA